MQNLDHVPSSKEPLWSLTQNFDGLMFHITNIKLEFMNYSKKVGIKTCDWFFWRNVTRFNSTNRSAYLTLLHCKIIRYGITLAKRFDAIHVFCTQVMHLV